MSVGETYLQVHGRVGTEVEFKESSSGIAMASFRLATTPRRFNRADQRWEDRPTAWFTVECWRHLAANAKASLQVGQPVYVTGRLKTKEWTDDQGVKRSRSDYIDAQSVGHDLSWGTAAFRRNERPERQADTSVDEEMDQLSSSVEAVGEGQYEEFEPEAKAA